MQSVQVIQYIHIYIQSFVVFFHIVEQVLYVLARDKAFILFEMLVLFWL